MEGIAPPIVAIYEGFFVFRISPQSDCDWRENVDSPKDCPGHCHGLNRHDWDGSWHSQGHG